MERAKAYFGSTEYEELIEEMNRCLASVGLLKDCTDEE